MSNFRFEMGQRMKEQRKALHFTQEYMAERLNISIKHYGEVERGIAGLSLENLIEVSEILGIGLDYLIKGNFSDNKGIPKRIYDIYLNSTTEKRQHIMELLEIIDKL